LTKSSLEKKQLAVMDAFPGVTNERLVDLVNAFRALKNQEPPNPQTAAKPETHSLE